MDALLYEQARLHDAADAQTRKFNKQAPNLCSPVRTRFKRIASFCQPAARTMAYRVDTYLTLSSDGTPQEVNA